MNREHKYKGIIDRKPIKKQNLQLEITKQGLVVGSILFAADVIFQCMNKDPIRKASPFLYGMFGFTTGSICYTIYRQMEAIGSTGGVPLEKRGKQFYKSVLYKVIIDQLIIAPVSTIFTVLFTILVSDQKYTVWKGIMFYGRTLIESYKLWPIAQTINFIFVPLEYRMAYVSIVSLVWNIYYRTLEKK
ncbi:protein Mpv17 [Nematocida sp. LUAm3]|nr:protein Mpv17 [Nematocida sp. LUAm3]KAI5173711.1 protein Mpv17 [Nematocida sp. LUAm2]KAI5176933.1 protein Mpv17 [Nematocida sp. LUAm1]